MIQFRATAKQVQEIAANAVKASSPMGMGHLHYDYKTEFLPEMFDVTPRGLFLDYVQGRMVKLRIYKVTEELWEMHETIRPDYESWIAEYPTVQDLLKSAGITL